MPVNYTPLTNGQLANAATFNAPLQQLDDAIEAISLGTKPLASPDITSFINSQHTHQSGAEGGLLSAAALNSGILTSELIPDTDAGGRVSINATEPYAVGAGGLTLYYVPARHRYTGLWDGTDWRRYKIPSPAPSVTIAGSNLFNSVWWLALRWTGAAMVLEAFPPITDSGAYSGNVTGATNATPIVITCASHFLTNDSIVTIAGVGGNTAANGTFRVKGVTATTFQLYTLAGVAVAGSGAYTSGGFFRSRNIHDRSGAIISGGAATPARQDGVWCMGASASLKYYRYVGMAQVDTNGTSISMVEANRALANVENRWWLPVRLAKADSHTYVTAAVRVWKDDLANRLELIQPDALNPVYLMTSLGQVSFGVSAGAGIVGGALNSQTVLGYDAADAVQLANGSIMNLPGGGYATPLVGQNTHYGLQFGGTALTFATIRQILLASF